MNHRDIDTNQYDFRNSLLLKGYTFCNRIASTLQGQIIQAKLISNNKENETEINNNAKNVVIKIANKTLHDKGIAIKKGVAIPINEDITREMNILKFLTEHNPPPYMTKYINYFDDVENHFLVMEQGSMDLFDFVRKFHLKYIPNGILTILNWQNICKSMFKQMITFIDWLHNEMNICHLDVSLENILISNVNISYNKATGQVDDINNFNIKFCDFGLAQSFDDKEFRCEVYAGKTGYKAPEVYEAKTKFDARLADVWSLGVVLFKLSFGYAPFNKPSKDDGAFNLLIHGRLDKILIHLKRVDYATPELHALLWKMFKPEENRITVKEVLEHSYLD